ncbi:hypothetical protein QTN98_24245, partial [Vibrio parahaemolyticus]
YEFIESYTGEYSISLMCRTLEVSRGGYYKWCCHTPSERSKRRERFEQLVIFGYFVGAASLVWLVFALNSVLWCGCQSSVTESFANLKLVKIG